MGGQRQTLLIDQDRIRKNISLKESIKVIEKVFVRLGNKQTQMPAKIYLPLAKYHGDFRAMPAAVEGEAGCSLKWVNVHPDNRRKGLPTVMAMLILSDPRTGYPLAVMDGTVITAIRTAAAGAVAAKYLARKTSKKVAVIGCGVQARYQLLALESLFSIEQVRICGVTRKEAADYMNKMKTLTSIKIDPAETVKECVHDADIIITTTPSKKPLIKLSWLKTGSHINAIGADAKGKQELESAILKKAKVIVDSWEQASHSGEINVPLTKGQFQKKDVYADIGQIVTKRKVGRTSDNEITVFDSTGLAIQDVAVANLVYKKILKLKNQKYFKFI